MECWSERSARSDGIDTYPSAKTYTHGCDLCYTTRLIQESARYIVQSNWDLWVASSCAEDPSSVQHKVDDGCLVDWGVRNGCRCQEMPVAMRNEDFRCRRFPCSTVLRIKHALHEEEDYCDRMAEEDVAMLSAPVSHACARPTTHPQTEYLRHELRGTKAISIQNQWLARKK